MPSLSTLWEKLLVCSVKQSSAEFLFLDEVFSFFPVFPSLAAVLESTVKSDFSLSSETPVSLIGDSEISEMGLKSAHWQITAHQ